MVVVKGMSLFYPEHVSGFYFVRKDAEIFSMTV